MSKRIEFAKIIAALTVGGAIGAGLMALFAPKSGQETRSELQKSGQQLLKNLKPATPRAANHKRISNWGNYPNVDVEFLEFESREELRTLVKMPKRSSHGATDGATVTRHSRRK